jgi:hypothetical protein
MKTGKIMSRTIMYSGMVHLMDSIKHSIKQAYRGTASAESGGKAELGNVATISRPDPSRPR